jgi:uncharacterized hydrophobic protein (TIGR00271 family)
MNKDVSATNDSWKRAIAATHERFSLAADRGSDQEIDTTLRAGVTMQGTNLWVLIFAIVIASVGLNVNSTAVIIGAMLISPLMGSIMGVGYGAGIYDFALVRRSLKNLGIATLISMITSTLYFLISPLTTAQSELLARTTPSIWDVLIAFFGGMAGIIGVTRKNKSNVIPGVAIATALMPPLCTSGYGLATGEWRYFFGAFYLFTINCVFIAAATALAIGGFKVRRKQFVDAQAETRVRYSMATAVVVTLLPSLYLAYNLVNEEFFRTRAAQFVREQLVFAGTHVDNLTINAKSRDIQVSLIGEVVDKKALNDISARLAAAGLRDASLQIFQTGDQRVDVAKLRTSLLGELYRDSQLSLEKKQGELQDLQQQVEGMQLKEKRFEGVPAEVYALYPQIKEVLLSTARSWSVDKGQSDVNTIIMTLAIDGRFSDSDKAKVESWLKARTQSDSVRLLVQGR